MLDLSHIDKTYNPHTVREKTIFHDFSLQIPDGQFVSVIGSNGSGKTSLLNLICGSLLPDAGTIAMDGRDITREKEHIRSRRIGRRGGSPVSAGRGRGRWAGAPGPRWRCAPPW